MAVISLALVALLVLTSLLGIDPNLFPGPLRALGSAFVCGHPYYLLVLIFVLFFAGMPVERRLGKTVLLAAWGLPCLLQFLIWHRAWPELAGSSLMLTLVGVSWLRHEARPWKLWAPLCLALAFMLVSLGAGLGPILLTFAVAALVARFHLSEAVQVLGIASGGLLLLAWLA